MKIPLLLVLSVKGIDAFAPASRTFVSQPSTRSRSRSTTGRFVVDPSSFFHEIPQSLDALRDGFGTLLLSDVDSLTDAVTSAAPSLEVTDAVTSAASDAAAASASSVQPAADAVSQAAAADPTATTSNGWFGFLTGPIEGLLQIIHSMLVAVGLSIDAWGVSIIGLTILIKALTYPLTKSQLESTTKMQKMQPAIKEIQTKYASNPEVMNQKVAEFYQTNDINPLAGCIPSLVQIPVFIGLYRAVLTLAKENRLDEPFLWLPNLEGPTYGADPTHGSDWILKGWVDGVPSLGWDDTVAFLILPVFLVVSQFVSMELMQPKTDNPEQQQSNVILKVLPLMIGWFSLNVPAALTLYWVTNNIITTATSLFIRNSLKDEPIAAVGGSAAAAAVASPPKPDPIFTPIREKPAGFGGAAGGGVVSESDPEMVKPITSTPAPAKAPAPAVEAVIVEKKEEEATEIVPENKDDHEGKVEEITAGKVSAETEQVASGKIQGKKKRKRGGKRRKKGN